MGERKNMEVKNRKAKVFSDFALYSFAGFGLEILLMMLEEMIYKNTFSQWT